MRRVVLLPLVAALAGRAAALPTAAQAQSRAACAAPAHGMMRCFARIETGPRLQPSVAASPFTLPGGYGPLQFHGAYSLPKLTPLAAGAKTVRKKQTIAIVDAYSSPTAFADLTKFDTTFGLPKFPRCSTTVTAACFQSMNETGGTKLPASGVPSGWDVEISLDVQAAHEICQNCKILLVEANLAEYVRPRHSREHGRCERRERRVEQLRLLHHAVGLGRKRRVVLHPPGPRDRRLGRRLRLRPGLPRRPEHGGRDRRHEPAARSRQHVRRRDGLEQQRHQRDGQRLRRRVARARMADGRVDLGLDRLRIASGA